MRARAGVGALAAVVLAVGAASLFRSGYSTDEEFTLFAVRGIEAHGLPLLPSGLLYDRGLAYSYLSWIVTAITGVDLPAFRALSLLFAAGALALLFALGRQLASPPAGALAAVLVAASMPFWAVATTGRFYAPFLATCLAVLFVISNLRTWRTLFVLCTLTFLSRLTHELAFTLMAVPALGLVVTWLDSRRPEAPRQSKGWSSRRWLAIMVAMAAGLLAAQAALTTLHYLAPQGGDTMIRRFFLWQVLNLFERPEGAPLGIVLATVIVAWLLIPGRALFSLAVGLCGAAMVTAFALARAMSLAPLSLALVEGAVAESLAYPLDMFWHIAGAHPVLLWLALALLVSRLSGAGGEWPAAERAAHLGWVGWVLWFGVIDSGITINYLLLPTVCMFVAVAIDLVAIGQHSAALWPGPRAHLLRAGLTAAALLVLVDQWPGTGSPADRLAAVRPTIAVAGIEAIRGSLQPVDRVACTDELACLLLVGRVDYWLALDDYVRERFLVTRDSTPVGVYAGAPAALRPSDLLASTSGSTPGRVIIVDVFKEYAVGHSRSWLPRALALDGLEARLLLQTPQARVVELLQPVGYAHTRPAH